MLATIVKQIVSDNKEVSDDATEMLTDNDNEH
jgi:hypothetical protein